MIAQSQFNASLDELLPEGVTHLVIGLSGGVDSVVLTHLCLGYIVKYPHISLQAVHVDHGINENSYQWRCFCADLCSDLGIPFHAQTVTVIQGARQSLEANARSSRYQIFESLMDQGVALLLAQHGDDQAETLLLNLKRGSGLAGLAAMPGRRRLAQGWLLRPLLKVRQQAILDYAAAHQLGWIEDPSNQDCRFDRNFLRQQVLVQLEQRWPGFVNCVQRSTELLQESQTLVDELAEVDYSRCGEDGALNVQALLALTQARCHNLIRYWLRLMGWSYPSQAQLTQIMLQLSAADDAKPQVELSDGSVRRYRGRIYPVRRAEHKLQAMPWDMLDKLVFGGDTLIITHGGPLIRPTKEMQVWVRFREDVGNPDFFPAGRGGRRSLKKLLQELGFPPWLRSRVPLIYYDDILVAIADRLIHCDWQSPDCGQGLSISWQICDNT